MTPSVPQLTETQGGSKVEFSIDQQLTADQRADMEWLLSDHNDDFTISPRDLAELN